MISSSSLREHLWFEHADALRRETLRVGCALIKRPHLSAVSFLKSVADFLAGTDIAAQPFASSEEAELWGPIKSLSSEPTGAKHGAFSRLLLDAFRFNDLRQISMPSRCSRGRCYAIPQLGNSDRDRVAFVPASAEPVCRSAIVPGNSRRGGGCQRCLNRGARFSTKAVMPSFWSSVANSE
jgi:hypothetical protein